MEDIQNKEVEQIEETEDNEQEFVPVYCDFNEGPYPGMDIYDIELYWLYDRGEY